MEYAYRKVLFEELLKIQLQLTLFCKDGYSDIIQNNEVVMLQIILIGFYVTLFCVCLKCSTYYCIVRKICTHVKIFQ